MSEKFRNRTRRGELIHTTVENAFLTASTLLLTILIVIVISFAVIFLR
jgi:hypothetical protein